jgi:preprotein translocase subunit SecG
MSLLFFMFIFLFLGVGVLLSLMVMMQESKNLGLGSSFGGDSSSSVFGAGTADVVKKVTAYLAVAFLAGCFILTYWSHSLSMAPRAVETEIESTQAANTTEES